VLDFRPLELVNLLYEKSNHRINREASRKKARLIMGSCERVLASNQRLLIETQGRIIQDLARRLSQLKQSIEEIKAQLEITIAATGQQLEMFNRLGVVLAGVLIGDTLSTERFDNDPNRFASYNGTAPAIKGSGQHLLPHREKVVQSSASDIIFAMLHDKIPSSPNIHRRKQAEGGKKKEENVAAANQRQEPSASLSPCDDTISRPTKRVKQREVELSPV
jgi:hypothetical protein